MSTSTNTDKQTRDYLDTVSYRLQQKILVEQKGEARLADIQHAAKKDRDTYLSSQDLENLHDTELDKCDIARGKPTLSAPTRAFGSEKMGTSESQGIISLIGKVMLLQAKCSSNSWKTLWEQASQSMATQLEFAPLIGNSIRESFDRQSEQTDLRSTQEWWSGGLNLAAAVGSFAYGTFAEVKNPSTKAEENTGFNRLIDENNPEATGVKQAQKNQNKETKLLEDAAQQQKTTDKDAENLDESVKEKSMGEKTKEIITNPLDSMKKLKNWYNGKRVMGALEKTFQAAMGVKMIVDGPINMTAASYDSKIADKQKAQGIADATSKESEQYAQYFGQAFSRAESLRENFQSAFDQVNNLLIRASDSLTSTVQSMFQRI